jgi:hypothetical protein
MIGGKPQTPNFIPKQPSHEEFVQHTMYTTPKKEHNYAGSGMGSEIYNSD